MELFVAHGVIQKAKRHSHRAAVHRQGARGVLYHFKGPGPLSDSAVRYTIRSSATGTWSEPMKSRVMNFCLVVRLSLTEERDLKKYNK